MGIRQSPRSQMLLRRIFSVAKKVLSHSLTFHLEFSVLGNWINSFLWSCNKYKRYMIMVINIVFECSLQMRVGIGEACVESLNVSSILYNCCLGL